MLKENIKLIRKQKGLSQEELAIELNVVRQTISKWEQGLSVPDSELLVSLSDVLETPVSVLLGETISEGDTDNLKGIAEKLKIINLQLAQKKENNRKIWHWLFIMTCLALIGHFVGLIMLGNTYMEWNYNDPELAVLGVGIHTFVWVCVRIVPILLVGSIVGICLTRKKQ